MGGCRYLRPAEPNLRPAARRDEDEPRSGGLTRSQREEEEEDGGVGGGASGGRWEERGEAERDREVGGDDQGGESRSVSVKSDPDDRRVESPNDRRCSDAFIISACHYLFKRLFNYESNCFQTFSTPAGEQ